MRTRILLCFLISAGLLVSVAAIDQPVNLSGTWILDPAKSDMGTPPSSRRGFPHGTIGIGGGYPGGMGGSYPGGSYPGGGYPGGGYPGGGYPGGTYPGGGYPGGTNPTGGYPGGGYPGGNYPGGRSGGGPDELPGGKRPGGQRDFDPLSITTLTILQSDQTIEIKHRLQGEGKEEEEIVQNFTWDGSTNSTPDWMTGGTFTCRTSWEKKKLTNLGTVKMSAFEGEQEMVLREEYSLEDKGKTLIIKTRRQSPLGDISTKRVFTRGQS